MDVTILEEKIKIHNAAMNKFIEAIKQYSPSSDKVKYCDNLMELFETIGDEQDSMYSAMYNDFIIPIKNTIKKSQ